MPRFLVPRRYWILLACLSLGFSASARGQSRLTTQPSRGESGRTRLLGSGRPSVPAATGDPRLARFDSRTRTLIEVELRDAATAEREEWLGLLATVDADQVPHLLQSRRRALPADRVAATANPVDVQNSESSTPATTDPAAGRASFIPIGGASDRDFLAFLPRDAAGTESAAEEPVPPATQAPADDDGRFFDRPSAFRRNWRTPLRPLRNDEELLEQPTQQPTSAGLQTASASTNRSRPSSAAVPAMDGTGLPSAYMSVELQRVMTLLRSELEQSRSDPAANNDERRRQELQLRLLQLLADEPELALQAIPGLPQAEQEAWTHLLWALANELSPPAGNRTSAERLVRTSDLLMESERHLREASPLEIRLACFCHTIQSYGNYERFPRDEFRPGQPVLLYSEVQNFHSELTTDGRYRTRMRTTVETLVVVDAATGALRTVDRRDFPATEDICRSPRRDYYHSYRLDLPQALTPGQYVLRLNLTDELGGKTATCEIPFVVR